jgi:pimeloyl-ACP methyl ester carboxylesterase
MGLLLWILLAGGYLDGSAHAASIKATTYNNTDPQWVRQHAPRVTTAVVFIHGIFGNTLGTWTADGGGSSFFQLLFNDPTVGQYVDVYAFGFTSQMFGGGSFDIQEAADKLQTYVDHDVLQQGYRQIIFVGHSMGGLVILKYLLTHREMLNRVPLVVFYATPQTGAQIADVANKIARNPALAEMLPADKDGYLRAMSSDWRSIQGTRPHVSCAYEKLATYGVLVVPWTSANFFCDEAATPIASDHIHIVKPARPNDDAVLVLVNALNRYAVGKQHSGKLQTPEFRPEGNHAVFDMDIGTHHPATLKNVGDRSLRYDIKSASDPLIIIPDDPVAFPNEPPTHLILPQSTTALTIRLGVEALPDRNYSFVLSSDVTNDQTVLVKVSNWPAVRSHWIQNAKKVIGALNDALQNNTIVARARRRGASSCEAVTPAKDARGAVVDVVRSTLAEDDPELPLEGQLLAAAEFLNAVNWPSLAVLPLQQLERVSPDNINTYSVMAVAASVSARSGVARIFRDRDVQALIPRSTAPLAVRNQLLVLTEVADESALLATRMQEVPSLRSFGLSLRGDLAWQRGDIKDATNAYQEAARIGPTPSLSYRLEQVLIPTQSSPSVPAAPSNVTVR